jgi:7-carboxy-7-deazaguanine synthase
VPDCNICYKVVDKLCSFGGESSLHNYLTEQLTKENNMAKYEWSEVFMSIEGEAKFTGHPTVYIRFSKCNFQCKGFNNPEGLDTTSEQVLGFQPKDYKDIFSIPLITRGCDSIYSWDEKFSHMWKKGTQADIGAEVTAILPNNSFVNPHSGRRTILSITGGEPTLRMKFLPDLLADPAFKECRHILIETNCSVPLKAEHMDQLHAWAVGGHPLVPGRITWSNSPKLSVSGEKWEEAIRPDIALMQLRSGSRNGMVFDQYFKFVCGPSEDDFAEVDRAMEEYFAAGIQRDTEVYVMPTACTEEQQQTVSAKVAQMCIDRGYIYCHRVQNSVFGNGVGT